MKIKLLVILFIGIGLLLSTCSKDEDIEMTFEEAIVLEALSEEEVEFWDNQESVELNVDEVLLPNGLTVKEFLLQMDPEFNNDDGKKSSMATQVVNPLSLKNLIIAEMSKAAGKYTNRDNFQFPAQEGIGPKQDGLAYSYGQKNHTIRAQPPSGDCTEWVYGLDCSGLVYRIFLESGIDLMDEDNETYANYQRKPSVIENAIKKKYPKYDKIKVKDLGKIDPEDFESGDIIYWLERNKRGILVAFHIGIVLKNREGVLGVAQSNGTRYENGNCAANYGPTRGPGFKSLDEATLPKGSGGLFCTEHGYGIVRIGAEAPDPPDLNRISVMVKAYGYYYETAPGSSRYYESDNGSIQSYTDYTGKFTENVFKATYSGTSLNVKISGTIEANFSYNYDTINTLRWTETSQASAWQNFKPYTHTRSCLVTKIPKAWGSISPIFQVEGESACEHILLLDNKLTSSELNYTLTDHECTWASKVFINMHKE